MLRWNVAMASTILGPPLANAAPAVIAMVSPKTSRMRDRYKRGRRIENPSPLTAGRAEPTAADERGQKLESAGAARPVAFRAQNNGGSPPRPRGGAPPPSPP